MAPLSSAECAVLQVELAEAERELAESAARRNERALASCKQSEEIAALERELRAVEEHSSGQQMLQLTLSREQQEIEQKEAAAAEKEMQKLHKLEAMHAWHKQHTIPAVWQAARDAELGVADAARDSEQQAAAEALSKFGVDSGSGDYNVGGSSSSSSSSSSSRKRKKPTPQYFPRPKTTHTVQMLGGHNAGESGRYAKVVQVLNSPAQHSDQLTSLLLCSPRGCSTNFASHSYSAHFHLPPCQLLARVRLSGCLCVQVNHGEMHFR